MIIIVELALYVLAYGLGLTVGHRVLQDIATGAVPAPEPVSLPGVLIAFAVATLVLFVVLKTRRRVAGMFMKILFVAALFLGIETVFAVFVGDVVAIGITALLLVFHVRRQTVLGHNLLFLTAAAGIGGVLGATISLHDAAILLAVLAVYDVVAVYVTRHMVTLAEGMLQSGTMFGVVVPRTRSVWTQRLQPLAKEKAAFVGKKTRAASSFFLGGGDIVLPMIVVVSALQRDVQTALILAGFALGGVVAMHVLFEYIGDKRPMPALPPLAGAVLLGLLFI